MNCRTARAAGQRGKYFDKRPGADHIELAPDPNPDMLLVFQMDHQTAGGLGAKCLDVRKIQRGDLLQQKGVRQNFARASVFRMDVLHKESPVRQRYIDKRRKKRFRADAELAAPPAGDATPGKAKQLFVSFQSSMQTRHDLRLLRAAARSGLCVSFPL